MDTQVISRESIPLTPVESSQIHAIGYHPETQTLAIQFKKKSGPGSIYHYGNVPQEMYEALHAAESKGRYFGNEIKPYREKFPYLKLDVKETV